MLTLLTLRACDKPFDDRIAKIAGFTLHGSMAVRADQRPKLERPYRYISWTAIAEQGLSLTRNGNVRYQLKMPYRDGTMHFIFDPFDFIARLAALAS